MLESTVVRLPVIGISAGSQRRPRLEWAGVYQSEVFRTVIVFVGGFFGALIDLLMLHVLVCCLSHRYWVWAEVVLIALVHLQ